MGNIDEKRLSALLERIITIKEELESLENEVRNILTATDPTTPVTEPVEVTAQGVLDASNTSALRQAQCTAGSVTEATEAPQYEEPPIDDTPIDIDFANIDLPPIIEDPVAAYDQAGAPAAEPSTSVTEPIPVTEPVEVTARPEPETENIQDAPDAPDASAVSGASTSSATETVATAEEDAPAQENDDLPFDDDLSLDIPEAEPKPAVETVNEVKPKAAIIDSTKPRRP